MRVALYLHSLSVSGAVGCVAVAFGLGAMVWYVEEEALAGKPKISASPTSCRVTNNTTAANNIKGSNSDAISRVKGANGD